MVSSSTMCPRCDTPLTLSPYTGQEPYCVVTLGHTNERPRSLSGQ
jgi:hypothetical protein